MPQRKTGLVVAEGLSMPLDAVTQTFGIFGIRGSGKTYTTRVFAEEMSTVAPVVILDPLGVYWGLKSSADGRSPGLPFAILGGKHADEVLPVHAPDVVAEFVVKSRLNVVIDLSGLRKDVMRRFAAGFLEHLYLHADGEPIHLILDEADLFAPQERESRDETPLLAAVDDVVRRGRVKGLGCTMPTQRPAALAMKVRSQIETLVTHALTGTTDVEAVERWMKNKASKDDRERMLASVAFLEAGEAWVCSPRFLKLTERVQVRRSNTFDSSETPKVGHKRVEPVSIADVDMGVLREAMASSIQVVEANDPKKLQARVHTLEERVRRAEAETRVEEREVEVRVEVVPDGVLELLKTLGHDTVALRDSATSVADGAGNLARKLDNALENLAAYQPGRQRVVNASPRAERQVPRTDPKPRPVATGGDERLGKAERLILSALAQYGPGSPTQVAMLAGYPARSKGFKNAMSSLRSAGYVSGFNTVEITPEGKAVIGEPEPLPTGRDLFDHWASKLGKAERAILGAVVDAWPTVLDVATVAARAEYPVDAKGFKNALSKLRTLQLVEGYDEIVPARMFVGTAA